MRLKLVCLFNCLHWVVSKLTGDLGKLHSLTSAHHVRHSFTHTDAGVPSSGLSGSIGLDIYICSGIDRIVQDGSQCSETETMPCIGAKEGDLLHGQRHPAKGVLRTTTIPWESKC